MSLFSFSHTENKLRTIEASKKFSSSGGKHRAKNLTPERRSEIASKASKTRWKNLQEVAYQDLMPGQVYA